VGLTHPFSLDFEVEKKPEPKHSVTEKMKFLQEQSNHQPEQKTPQQKKQNMEL
jgi:murein L,D-transpeptidase YafK